ncbi:hypothetical protein [Roseateles sp.]|uniref:hypothetical protein n=1 Tax=Roseateles sp. TaxID=1971397 RepID=UPI0031D7A254
MSTIGTLGLPSLAASPLPPSGETGAAASGARAGYGLSLADIGGFEQALLRAEGRIGGTSGAARVAPTSEVAAQLFKPFDHINAEAETLGRLAESARAAGNDMRPGDVVQLTLRCQEFMFHCQLTANIANRGSDGLQQLFRQQG